MLDNNFGKVQLHVEEMLKKRGSSTVLLDINVLGRMCTVLDCDIGDILEFIPPEKTN